MKTENQERTYKQAVKITVDWWIEKSFNTPMNQNNGDDSSTGGIAFVLMNELSSDAQSSTNQESIEKFRTKLTELLLAKEGANHFHNQLDVDYHPNGILRLACEYADVNPMLLPIKTFTRINDENYVEGRYQYGGDWFKL